MTALPIAYGNTIFQSVTGRRDVEMIDLSADIHRAMVDVAGENPDCVRECDDETLIFDSGTLVWNLVCHLRITAFRTVTGDYLGFTQIDERGAVEVEIGEWPVNLADHRQVARTCWHVIDLCSV